MKKIFCYLNRYPQYIGFYGALIGVLLGGLISFISLDYNKKVDLEIDKKKHIEELYANLCYSYSILKDMIITSYLGQWDMYYSEIIISEKGISKEEDTFYSKRFNEKYIKTSSENMVLSKSLASFKKDYNLLILNIDLNKFDDYFNDNIESEIIEKIESFKKIPPNKLAKFTKIQHDILYTLLNREIDNSHRKGYSMLFEIHKIVLIKLKD